MKIILKANFIFLIGITMTTCITRGKVDPDFKNIREDIVVISLMPHNISAISYDTLGIPEINRAAIKDITKDIDTEITRILSKKYKVIPSEQDAKKPKYYYDSIKKLVNELKEPGKSLLDVKVPQSICEQSIYTYNLVCIYNGFYKTDSRIAVEEEYIREKQKGNNKATIENPKTLELAEYNSRMSFLLFNKESQEVIYFSREFHAGHPLTRAELEKKLTYYLRDLYYKRLYIK